MQTEEKNNIEDTKGQVDVLGIDAIVQKLYTSSKTITKEFIEDGVALGFKDIPMIVWYNAISSICALALRMPYIAGNEKLQEDIVYKTMLLILTNDVPIEKSQRDGVIAIYKSIAPTIIDVLIPGKDGYKCFCFPRGK